jgi:hypothetical protein
MSLCIAAAEAYHEEKDGTELLDRRVPVESKEIGERVQYNIDDVHHGQRPILKGLSKTCQYRLTVFNNSRRVRALALYVYFDRAVFLAFDANLSHNSLSLSNNITF